MQISSLHIKAKARDYRLLIKFSLSVMVSFSAVVSYLLAPKVEAFDWTMIALLFLGGLLVTGSANAINEVAERETDAMMKRTADRPVAAGRMRVSEAMTAAIVMLIAGLLIIGVFFNLLAAAVSLASWFIYAYMYTPLKKVSSVSVLVGAVPGALPCLIGWAAGNDDLAWGGWTLFFVQFFWQFPHFWAIAWVAHNDYTNAGFKLMPSVEGPTKYSALQSVIYALVMLPIGALPYLAGISGIVSFWIVLGANLFILWQCIRLYREMEKKAARRVMFSSYFYLPLVLLTLLAFKNW
jgi:protoheme IX farnesyltransferase